MSNFMDTLDFLKSVYVGYYRMLKLSNFRENFTLRFLNVS